MGLTPAEARIRRWREHPAAFVREVLHAAPDPWQEKVLEAFPHQPRISLQACKGPGKTTVLSWIGWNFLATRPHPKVVCTSVTEGNLYDGLWTELAKWQLGSDLLRAMFHVGGERIVSVEHPKTWWCSARTWSKSADKKAQADALAGLHGDYILFLLDEAGGIPEAVAVTAEAALANAMKERGTEAHLVQAGNPTVCEGPLYRAATTERHLWWRMEITGDPEDPLRAPRVAREWAQQQIDKYGRDHDWVRINVFGKFPRTASTKLIAIADVEDAIGRDVPPEEYLYFPAVLALDVARFGDDESVLLRRQGRKVFPPQAHRGLDLMQLTGHLTTAATPRNISAAPRAIFIDEGGLGAGVVDRSRQLGLRGVYGVNFGGRPVWGLPGDPVFRDRRAEMWWRVKEALPGLSIPRDWPELIRDLTAPNYRFDKDNRLCLESKDDLKKRGCPSPDHGDALALTYAQPIAVEPQEERSPGAAKLKTHQTAYDYDPLTREVA